MNPARGGWLIMICIAGALVLSLLHLPQDWPEWLGWLRPQWVLLVVFYWVMELPHRIGLVSAWITGLLIDVLVADPIGVNGLILATCTYITWRFYERLRMYTVLQQCSVVFVLVLGGEMLKSVVQYLAWERTASWGIVLTAVVSTLVWPFLNLFLLRLKQQFSVQ